MNINYENLLRTLHMATERIDQLEIANNMYLRENSIFERMLMLGLGEKTEKNQGIGPSTGSHIKKEIYASIYEIEEHLGVTE